MPKAIYDDVLRFLHHACGLKGGGDKPDRELVERYLGHEEAAFSLLMQRHGPMILGICRRLAADPHAAEDGFQATFMVLVRQAASIRKKESLAPWLHRVARRLVLKARAKAAANQRREERMLPMASPDPLQELTVRELRSCLDEEIARLPVKYQTPILLCYFEGKSYSQAAQEIGCPKTTFTNRLNRALELLRRQLNRRGVTLAGAALASALTEAAAAPPLPAILAVNTMKAATLLGGSKAVACGCLTATALALAEEALTGMMLVKGKIVLMVLALGLAVGGVGWAGYKELVEKTQPVSRAMVQRPAQKKQAEKPAKEEKVIAKDLYGDPLPEGASARFGSIHWRHGSRIINSALSPDGKLLATVSNNSVIVWDLATGGRLHKFLGDDKYSFQIPGLEFSPDGRRLVYTQHPGLAVVWDLISGKEIRRIQDPERSPLTGPSHFTPDGESLILTEQERTEISNLSTGKEIRSIPVGNIFQISADGKSFLREEGQRKPDSKREIHLGDLLTGTTKLRVEVGPDRSDLNPGEAYAVLAPDGKSFAVLQSSLGLIELRDTTQGKVLATFKVTDRDCRLGFTADGKTLWFIAGSGVVYRWDVESRKELAILSPATGYATGYHELADNKTAITTTVDGWIQHWDRQAGRPLTKEEGYLGRMCADFSPDGSLVAVADSRGRMDLWDTARGSRIKALRGTGPGVVRLAFAPDGKHLGTIEESGKLQLWEINTGRLVKVLLERAEIISPKEATLLFCRDGRFVFFGLPFREAHLLEISSGRQIWSGKGPHAAALSSDGRTLIAVVGGPRVVHFDLETGKELYKIRISLPDDYSGGDDSWAIYSLASAPDGRRHAFGLYNGQILLLDYRKEPRLESFLLQPQVYSKLIDKLGIPKGSSVGNVSSRLPWVRGLAFSPDGNWVVSGRTDDSKVRVHEFSTGKEVVHFQGHDSGVLSVTVSPDGRKVLSSGSDGQAFLWDLHPSQAALPRKKVPALWDDLASEDARQAYMAIWSLVDVPRESLQFLKGKLKPVTVPEKIQKWIADLDSETFAIRQSAAKELEKVGDQVQAPIQKVLQGNPSLETRRRLEQVLKSLPDIPGPETIRTIRAIMALERIGTPEACGILEALAGGAPGARETEEARGSVERLTRRGK